ncbi:hypothetical protein LDENG_00207220 [Lucifuga dentata]|nr:hypothetical protein LDENG_00207220 [Lucifuga dentata]
MTKVFEGQSDHLVSANSAVMVESELFLVAGADVVKLLFPCEKEAEITPQVHEMSFFNTSSPIFIPKYDLAQFAYAVSQFQAVQDPAFLCVDLMGAQRAAEFSREQQEVLHEDPHRPSSGRRDLIHAARVKVKADVLGSGQTWSPFLNPGQRSSVETSSLSLLSSLC